MNDYDDFHDWLILDSPEADSELKGFDVMRYHTGAWPNYLKRRAGELNMIPQREQGLILAY